MLLDNLDLELAQTKLGKERAENTIERLVAALSLVSKQNEQLQQELRMVKLQNEQLQAQSKPIHDFISHVGHELRTPLNAINGLSNLLQQNYEQNLSPSQIDQLTIIHEAGDTLLHAVNDLLDFSKLESGQVSLKQEEVNLTQLVNDIRLWFSPIADKHNLHFDVIIDPKISSILSEEIKLIQILKQFLNNALKFTKTGSITLELISCEDNDFCAAEIRIHDTGCGIAEDKLDLIFEQFQQEDNLVSRKYEGLGLGLSIAHKITQLIGAKIRVESEIGKGSIFSLLLPPNASESNFKSKFIDIYYKKHEIKKKVSEKVLPIEQSALHKMALDSGVEISDNSALDYDETLFNKSVLVVDDNIRNLFTISTVLENKGLTVLTASNGFEALEILKDRDDIHAVLTDIMMPEMDGYSLISYIRSNEKISHIPILAISANSEEEGREKSINVGANEYLTKPINENQLINLLKVNV